MRRRRSLRRARGSSEAPAAGRPRRATRAQLLRRMHEGRGRAVCAGLHEALSRVALRQCRLPWHAGHGRLAGLDRSRQGIGQATYQPGGHFGHRRSAGAGAAPGGVREHWGWTPGRSTSRLAIAEFCMTRTGISDTPCLHATADWRNKALQLLIALWMLFRRVKECCGGALHYFAPQSVLSVVLSVWEASGISPIRSARWVRSRADSSWRVQRSHPSAGLQR